MDQMVGGIYGYDNTQIRVLSINVAMAAQTSPSITRALFTTIQAQDANS